jgi:hypothetical protein
MTEPSFEFLLEQQKRILAELRDMRTELRQSLASADSRLQLIHNDIQVLSAMAIRQDNSSKTLHADIRDLIGSVHHLVDRVRALEDR